MTETKNEMNVTEDVENISSVDFPFTVKQICDKLRRFEQSYLAAKRELKLEKARLGIDTDWKKEFPDKSRVTQDDKKDFITLAVSDLQETCDALEVQYHYQRELWELQKTLLKLGYTKF